jgi:serine/threonine protein kinase/Tfp pilus assembly protein PilF
MLPASSGIAPDVGAPSISVSAGGRFVDDEPSGDELAALPETGEEFLGFRLIAELGRGAFGKVFLARQKALANRLVAVKVSIELFDETQTLAQLQHTNIVPIYSTHRAGQLQAFCMPFFGAATLADVVRGLLTEGAFPTSGRHLFNTIESRSSQRVQDAVHSSLDSNQSNNGEASIARPPHLIPGAQPTFDLFSRYSFVDTVLFLGARLAEGLAHAHERGVIHRDLKPANVLLADDGRPMLLDFNLSINSRLRSSTRGGTVPYMAPEQFQNDKDGRPVAIDARADIYALGLILYELLTGRSAWPRHRGPAHEVTPKLLADRKGTPPPIPEINPGVSPAVEAIVLRCLAFDPKDRYQTARALHEDLECQLANLPLKHTREPSFIERVQKWKRRHPRLTSAGTISAVAAVIVAALGLGLWSSHVENRKRDARDSAQQFLVASDDLRNSLIRSPDGDDANKAVDRAKELFKPYGVTVSGNWQKSPLVTDLDPQLQARFRDRMGEMLLLTSQRLSETATDADALCNAHNFNSLAGNCYPENARPMAWWWHEQALCERIGETAAVESARAALANRKPTTAGDHYLFGLLHYQAGRYAAAIPSLEQATNLDPQQYWAWVLLGNCRYMLNHDEEAKAAYTVALGIDSKNHRPYFNRAQVNYRMGRYASALDDYSEAISHGCAKAEAQLQQAKCNVARYESQRRAGKKDLQPLEDAEATLTELIDRGELVLRTHNARADVRRRKGDKKGATEDQAQVLKLEPVTASDFLAQGQVRAGTEPEAALESYRSAARLNPFSVAAWMNQANLLSERLNKPEESLNALNKALEIAPEYPPALGGRAIVLARLGRADEALRDAETCLAKFDHPFVRYQMAGVYALTADRPGHLQKAVQLIAGAVRRNMALASQLDNDRDLKPIEKSPEFRKLREATTTLREMD